MGLLKFSARFYVAATIFVLIALFAFVGPLLFPHRTITAVVGGLYDHPSAKAWLGTDNVGHDVFANLMYGTRTSLIVGLVAGAVAVLAGVILGTVAGYVGGAVEEGIMGVTNVVIAIPQFVVLILISIALHSRSATGVALVIAVTSWPWTARAVRAQASSIRVREHLDIARLSGSGTSGMILYDVIPYMLSYICMAFVLQMSSAILTEAAMSLLGLGPSNGVSLGIMLHWSLDWESIRTGAWWAFVPPTVFLTLIAFSLLMLQTSLDEVFNPRLRRGGSRRRIRTGVGTLATIGATGTAEPVVIIPGAGPPAEVPADVGARSRSASPAGRIGPTETLDRGTA